MGERPLALVLLCRSMSARSPSTRCAILLPTRSEAAGISRYGILLQVRFVKTLARTSVGKMNKRLMRADPDA